MKQASISNIFTSNFITLKGMMNTKLNYYKRLKSRFNLLISLTPKQVSIELRNAFPMREYGRTNLPQFRL